MVTNKLEVLFSLHSMLLPGFLHKINCTTCMQLEVQYSLAVSQKPFSGYAVPMCYHMNAIFLGRHRLYLKSLGIGSQPSHMLSVWTSCA